MKIKRASLNDCDRITGAAVVIDVLRAFTTAAYAFAAGAEEIILVSTVEEAFALRAHHPGVLLTGEVRGKSIAGFDFGNSPLEFTDRCVKGKTLVQRTTAGTQGVVRSKNAAPILCTGFATASATVRSLLAIAPPEITLVCTGVEEEHGGEADIACADLLQQLLEGRRPDPAPFLRRVLDSAWGQLFGTSPELPSRQDLAPCARLDTFDFAMQVARRGGIPVLSRQIASFK